MKKEEEDKLGNKEGGYFVLVNYQSLLSRRVGRNSQWRWLIWESGGGAPNAPRPRPRTKNTAASVLQKKGLQKSFLGDLQFICVARIFDWGRPKSHAMRSSKNFPNRKFLWDKDIKGWKI